MDRGMGKPEMAAKSMLNWPVISVLSASSWADSKSAIVAFEPLFEASKSAGCRWLGSIPPGGAPRTNSEPVGRV
jgi:hypothetical protein